MCRMLGVSRSGYYDWCVRAPSARTTANLALLHDVRRLQARHQGRFGSPRMHAALRAEGHRCSRGRVERLMRRHRIRSEEHTSELQSLMRISYAVFCLKKKHDDSITNNQHNVNDRVCTPA